MISRQNTLFVTHCCWDKNPVCGDPLALYKSDRIQRFGNRCNEAGVRWAILSAKHGLFFPDERHEPYDMTLSFNQGCCRVKEKGRRLPVPESRGHVEWLVGSVGPQLNELSVRHVVFYVQGRQPANYPIGYLLVVHWALDACTQQHATGHQVLGCISNFGRLRIASGKEALHAEFQKLRQASG